MFKKLFILSYIFLIISVSKVDAQKDTTKFFFIGAGFSIANSFSADDFGETSTNSSEKTNLTVFELGYMKKLIPVSKNILGIDFKVVLTNQEALFRSNTYMSRPPGGTIWTTKTTSETLSATMFNLGFIYSWSFNYRQKSGFMINPHLVYGIMHQTYDREDANDNFKTNSNGFGFDLSSGLQWYPASIIGFKLMFGYRMLKLEMSEFGYNGTVIDWSGAYITLSVNFATH